MKLFKKMMALVVAMVMVLAMNVTAFADPDAKAADLTGHTYKAYQIFTGTQAADDTTGKLADVQWGTGINKDAFLTALKTTTTFGDTNPFASCTTAEDVANAMKGWADKSDNAKAFAKLADQYKTGDGVDAAAGITTLDAGYYLVLDVTEFAGDAKDTVKNLALLQMTKKGTFDIENKTDIPEVEKKVADANDTEDAAVTDPAEVAADDWKDSADHDVNDVIPYKLTGTLPTNYADYKTYNYEFTDVMCGGLTYNEDAKVYAVNNGTKTEITSHATITGSGKGATLVVTFTDLKAITDATINNNTKIVVEYTATLNGDAVMGATGNPNTVVLKYSNNPNYGGDGETGETPEDKVIVFTYKVDVNKVDQDNEDLAGAAFTLYKNYKGYTDDEITAAEKTVVTAIKYNNDKNTYPIADGDKWVQVGTTTAGTATDFAFERIDDGEYLLVETTTPSGYNAVKPSKFEVTATHTAGAVPELSTLSATDSKGTSTDLGEITLTTEDENVGVETTIINQSGSTLPETGGIGTTIFYVLGAILVLGGTVVLVTRRRMAA